MAAHTASTARSTSSRSGPQVTTEAAWLIAVVGSLSPCPVRTQTTRPSAPYLRSPATDAAEAGSQKMPSRLPSRSYAERISSSVTARTSPREAVNAFIASSHRAGLPILIADATVSGFSTTRPSTSGAAPAAWYPCSTGAVPYSWNPFHQAVTLPALPTGMHRTSGASSSWSQTSKAPVFWPSIRKSFSELTSAIGLRSTTCRVSLSASSKLPLSATTRAPCISAWASLPAAILPSGTITAPRRPARAAYAAALAAVFPVDAHITASTPSSTAAETATVMPRSLNEPVGLRPSYLSHTSQPVSSEIAGAGISGVSPSSRVTRGSTGSRSA